MQHNTMQRIFSRCHCRHHHHTECILLCYYATGCSFKISHFYHNILFQDEIIFNVFYALFFLFLSHYVCTLRAFSFLAICLCQVVKKHSEDCRNIQILESNIYNAFIIQQYSKVLKTFSACTSYPNVSHMYYSNTFSCFRVALIASHVQSSFCLSFNKSTSSHRRIALACTHVY